VNRSLTAGKRWPCLAKDPNSRKIEIIVDQDRIASSCSHSLQYNRLLSAASNYQADRLGAMDYGAEARPMIIESENNPKFTI
jgi:hypothetical protein